MLWSTLVCIINGIRLDYNNSLTIFLIKNAQVASTDSQYRKVSPKSEKEKIKKLSLAEADWKSLPSPEGATYQEKTKQDTEKRLRTGV